MSESEKLFRGGLRTGATESFRTRRGRCFVDADAGAISLNRSLRERVARYREGGVRYVVPLAGFELLAAAAFLYEGYRKVQAGEFRSLAAFLGFILLLVILLSRRQIYRGITRDETIPLDAVSRVERRSHGLWGTPKFVVHYEAAGRERQRSVRLPSGFLSYVDDEADAAESLFRRHGVAVTG